MKYRSRKHIEEARRRRRRRSVVILITIAIAAAAAYFITRNQNFQITEVKIEGVETVNPKNIEKDIYFIIDDSRLFFFANQANFAFPEKEAINKVLSKHPRLATAEIDISGHTLTMKITEKLPDFIVCKSLEEIIENCSVADELGEFFTNYTIDLQEDFPKLTKIIYPELVPTNKKPVDENDREFIKQIRERFTEANVEFSHILLYQRTLSVFFGNNISHIKFLTTRPVADQIRALETTVSALPALPTNINSYQYIDLRFEDRVYLNKLTEEDLVIDSGEEAEILEENQTLAEELTA